MEYLQEHGTTSLVDLSDQVGAMENDTTPAALPRKDRKRAYVGLYQVHLPKLHDAGLLEFDRDAGEVAVDDRDRFAAVLGWLDTDRSGTPDAGPEDVDRVFDRRSNPRRLLLLAYLFEHDGTAGISGLFRHVASQETGAAPDELSDQEYDRGYVVLYKTHLPALGATGVLDWESDRTDVRLVRSDDALRELVWEGLDQDAA